MNSMKAAYDDMTKLPAWKDLVDYAEGEMEASMKRIDSKSASDLNIGEVCEERGVRAGIRKILRHVDMRKEGI